MKTKTKKPFLNMDERGHQLALRIVAIMYFLTILSMQFILIYRQFVLGQEIREFEGIAIITTVNSLFLVSALLYFGALPVRKLNIKSILLVYGLVVLMGSAFTFVKYMLVRTPGLTFRELFDKLIIVYAVSGIIMAFFALFSFLGKRRLEKELE